MLKYVFRDCVTSVSKCTYAFLALMPIVAVLSSFFVFLRWNNYHIVLGDQSNHTPVFHAPQIFYFVAFTLIPTFHLDLLPHAVAWNVTQLKRSARNAMSMPNFLGIVCVGVLTYKFTMIHPFILADNRHYTFYLWKKVLKHRFVQMLVSHSLEQQNHKDDSEQKFCCGDLEMRKAERKRRRCI